MSRPCLAPFHTLRSAAQVTAYVTIDVLCADRYIQVLVMDSGAADVLNDPMPLFPEPQAVPGRKPPPREGSFLPPVEKPPPLKPRPNPEYDQLKAQAGRLAKLAETKATAVTRELADLDVSAGGNGVTGVGRGSGSDRPRGALPGEGRPSYSAALLALRAAVRLALDDPALDGDGAVDARDAALIAQRAAVELNTK